MLRWFLFFNSLEYNLFVLDFENEKTLIVESNIIYFILDSLQFLFNFLLIYFFSFSFTTSFNLTQLAKFNVSIIFFLDLSIHILDNVTICQICVTILLLYFFVCFLFVDLFEWKTKIPNGDGFDCDSFVE